MLRVCDLTLGTATPLSTVALSRRLPAASTVSRQPDALRDPGTKHRFAMSGTPTSAPPTASITRSVSAGIAPICPFATSSAVAPLRARVVSVACAPCSLSQST